MEIVANFEIKSETSVIRDEMVLRFSHPKGRYSARVQNIPRDDYSTPFLLSVHLSFTASTLDEATDIAYDHLADFQNMLAFSIGSACQFHRLRQVVDATAGSGEFRTVLLWGETADHEDPQPFLHDDTVRTVESLWGADSPAAVQRAMRWYRIALSERWPEDQFTAFWFALEILAEHLKAPEKVPSKCPHCQSPLYCETCSEHPVHRPYPKQAIASFLKIADPKCSDETIQLLDRTRNALMHGTTLKDIEHDLPEPRDEIVDTLGRLVWRGLLHLISMKIAPGKLSIGYPSTYLRRTMRPVANMQTILRKDAAGDFDLSFKGFTMEAKPFGPPQSALPTIITMDAEQHKAIVKLAYANGPHKEMFERIRQTARNEDEKIRALVLDTDMKAIQAERKKEPAEDWAELLGSILDNGLLQVIG